MHFSVGGIDFGIREVVIGLILVLALYMAFLLFRMRHLGSPAQREAPQVPAMPPELPADEPPSPRERPAARYREEPEPTPHMAEHLIQAGLERELFQLRDEVDILRGELAALREDMLKELAHLRANQSVVPIYGDAMQMATAGYDAATIAERCGIARAEAELVVALAQSQR